MILKNLRKKILEVSHNSNAGHIPSAFSILEIIYSCYKNVLEEGDEFLLSKGHGCLGLYAVFYDMGFISEDEFNSFCKFDSKLGGHPDRNKLKHIKISSGSLGHGMPIAVGIALSKKIKKEKGRVFCLVGDGECNEGTTWESFLLADKLKLDNLVCLIDNNKSQVRAIPTNNFYEKLKSFNFLVKEVNGHNIDSITEVLKEAQESPSAIIFNTIKGYGIKEMEDNMFSWHHGSPDENKYKQFITELNNEKPI
jgi:transketolase